MSERRIVLDLPVVVALAQRPELVQRIPLMQRVCDRAAACAKKLQEVNANPAGCSTCRRNAVLLQEYKDIYTLFVETYIPLWQTNREALLPLKELLNVDVAELATRDNQRFAI